MAIKIHPTPQQYDRTHNRFNARSQDTEIDDALSAGDRIGPLEAMAAAGKSPGEVALFWRDRGVLIVGDTTIGNPPRYQFSSSRSKRACLSALAL